MRRRDFVRAIGIGSAGFGLRRPGADRLNRIGIELYTVRDELQRDPERTLRLISAIGFQEVEFSSYPAIPVAELRRMLQRHHLTAPAGHVPLQSLRGSWEKTLADAATIGQRYVVVATIPSRERSTLDGWKRLAMEFNRAGEVARKHGLRFGYHNHDVEFPKLEGRIPYDVLLEETDPGLVCFEMDLYWITKGGKDPLDYFARWPGRFPIVHVKDMDRTPRQFFADVGTGSIDFRRIFRRARQAGIRHYFYEQDETPGEVFASARASYAYLRALTF